MVGPLPPGARSNGEPTCAYLGNDIGAVLPVIDGTGDTATAFFGTSSVDHNWVAVGLGTGEVCLGAPTELAQALNCGYRTN